MKLFVGNKEVSYLSLGNNEISAEIIDKYFENLSERVLEFSDISDTECYVTAKKSGIEMPDILRIPKYHAGKKVTKISGLGGSSVKNVIIPNSVTIIDNGTFSECISLVSVSIPNSVTTIGDGAFHACESLASIIIPNSVVDLGVSAFSRCSSLTSVTISNKVKQLRTAVFAYAGLTEVFIPDSVEVINNNAFNNCINLKKILGCSGVTKIETAAFHECINLETVPNMYNLQTISTAAFNTCRKLSEFWFCNNKLSDIDDAAFCYCDSLTSITLPSTITNLGTAAFADCPSLTKVEIPKNKLTSVSSYLLSGCSAIEEAKVSLDIVNSDVMHLRSLKRITITDGNSTVLNSGVLTDCINLKSIVLSAKLTSIQANAFTSCSPTEIIDKYNYITEANYAELGIIDYSIVKH